MNTKKLLKFGKIVGLFVLNCFSMFFGSEEDRDYIAQSTRRIAAINA